MAQKWVTVTQACQHFGISKRTLFRWIEQGKIESKLEDGRRVISVTSEGQDDTTMSLSAVEQLRSENELLRQQLERKDQQIERQQAIIMQLSRDVESQQQLLEYHREPFWRRWLRGK